MPNEWTPPTGAQPPTLPRVPNPGGGELPNCLQEPDELISPAVPQVFVTLPTPDMGQPLGFIGKTYTQCRYDNRYERTTGYRVAPVMGPSGTGQSVTRHNAGGMKRTVTWTVECVGEKPTIPDSTPTNNNEILIKEIFIPVSPHYIIDGTPVLRASGIYEYELIVPLSATDLLFTANPQNNPTPNPISPFGPQTVVTYSQSDRSKTIIGPAPAPANGPGTPITF